MTWHHEHISSGGAALAKRTLLSLVQILQRVSFRIFDEYLHNTKRLWKASSMKHLVVQYGLGRLLKAMSESVTYHCQPPQCLDHLSQSHHIR